MILGRVGIATGLVKWVYSLPLPVIMMIEVFKGILN